MKEPTKVPSRKVLAGGGVGAFVTLVVWILNTYVPYFSHQPITAEVAALAVTVLSGLTAWGVPPGRYETISHANGRSVSATMNVRHIKHPKHGHQPA